MSPSAIARSEARRGHADASDSHGAVRSDLDDGPGSRAAVGADRGRYRCRRQRHDERAARRPRRPDAADRQRHGSPAAATRSAARPSPSARTQPTSRAPASSRSSGRSWSSARPASPRSRPTPTAPYSATWNSTSSPDGAAVIHAVITDAAGNTSTTADVPVLARLDRPERLARRSGRQSLGGTISLNATTGGGAAPRRLLRLPRRHRDVDADCKRHERSVQHAARHVDPGRRALRPPRRRLRRARQRLRAGTARRTSASTTRRRRSSPRPLATERSRRPPTRSC